MIHKVIAV